MKVFFDTEFTGLRQNTTLISIGLVSDTEESFYAEFSDYDMQQVDEFVYQNVIKKLKFPGGGEKGMDWRSCSTNQSITEAYGDEYFIFTCLKKWFNDLKANQAKIWSDCLAYDWVLFCQMWGGALHIPQNIYYIPFDICTLFEMKGINPDINREEFAMLNDASEKHNALWDAKVIKKCYEKLILM